MTAVRPDPDELHERCIATVVVEGERFGVLAQELESGRTPVSGGLAVGVPWVPAWTVRDLVAHLGAVHRWATGILRAGSTEPPEPASRFRAPDDDLAGWYALGLTELVATLRTVDPDAPAWHMSPAASRRARDWSRRQAHEHVVHRLDLEAAAGVDHAPVDVALAADGVDELLGNLPHAADFAPKVAELRGEGEVLALHAPDAGAAWRIELVADGFRWERAEAAAPTASLTAPAAALLLVLYGRYPTDRAEVAVDGDPVLLDRWLTNSAL